MKATLGYLGRSLAYYLITGMFVSCLALVNRYPLVYADSGAYMASSFSLLQSDDRPIGYGLIIRALTWQDTMWTVVLFQGAVASWLFMLMTRLFILDRNAWVRAHLLLLGVLICGSSLPWYSAQLMADHFTPLIIMIIFLLFQAKDLGKWREGALWLLLFFFLATHNAHLPMALGLGCILLLRRLSRAPRPGRRFWVKYLGLLLTVGGSALMIMLFNFSRSGHMRLSRAGNVFLTGRFSQAGILQDYLRTACKEGDNVMCKYRDHLPLDAGDLLWSSGQMVSMEHLSTSQADSLLAPLVSDILHQPKYLLRYGRSVGMSTLVQLFQWDSGAGLEPYKEGSPPFHLKSHIPTEAYAYDHARQQEGQWLDHVDATRREAWVLVISLLVLGFEWNRPPGRARPLMRSLAYWVIAWIILNALITSAFSVIDPRLASRVMWLLPMTAFFAVIDHPWAVRVLLATSGRTLRTDLSP